MVFAKRRTGKASGKSPRETRQHGAPTSEANPPEHCERFLDEKFLRKYIQKSLKIPTTSLCSIVSMI